jgi:hypothetical protein
MNNKNLRSIAATALAILTLCGCTSLQYVPVNRAKPEELRSQLSVGETVVVRMVNGDQHEFRVVALEADAIVGKHERIAYRDIDLIEVKYADYKGTALTAGAVAALAVVVIGGVILDAESENDLQAEPRCRTNGTGGMVCTPQ